MHARQSKCVADFAAVPIAKNIGCLKVLRSAHRKLHRWFSFVVFPCLCYHRPRNEVESLEIFASAKRVVPEPLCQIYGRRTHFERDHCDRDRMQLGPKSAGDPYVQPEDAPGAHLLGARSANRCRSVTVGRRSGKLREESRSPGICAGEIVFIPWRSFDAGESFRLIFSE